MFVGPGARTKSGMMVVLLGRMRLSASYGDSTVQCHSSHRLARQGKTVECWRALRAQDARQRGREPDPICL